MSKLDLKYVSGSETSARVKMELFSGNIISTKNTADGVPTPDYHEAVEQLDIGTLRYPAGQPDTIYADGMLHGEGLHDHLTSFLDWAQAENYKVLLVTPTFESYPGPEVISKFVELVLAEYGDIVTGFEVGNEYWQKQSEAEYGVVANETILAIEEVTSGSEYDPQILVQMANPSGASTSYPSGTGSWSNRVVAANEEIIENISSNALDEIDAVVEHYYYNIFPDELTGSSQELNFIPQKHSVWESELDRPLDLHITEWNITNRNMDALGMRAAPILLQQFEYMVTMGVDAAYVWPPHHNTANDLAGSGEVVVDPQTGLVINSIGGAVFDLMSTSLVGTDVVNLNFEGMDETVNVNAYASDAKTVLYVSSFSEGISDISFDLSGYIDSYISVDGILVGYDPATSNGRHFNGKIDEFVDSEYVTLEGENYYLNEHDVRAKITTFDESELGGGTSLNFQLKPYEVIQITYHHDASSVDDFTPPPADVVDEDMNIVGSSESDIIAGGSGDDSIDAGSGDDWVIAGAGDDHIIGNRGNDTIDANDGMDIVNGWGGDDLIYGDAGDDRLYGQQGADTIFGGSGNDKINGGEDDDKLNGGDGHDTLNGGDGDDFIFGGESSADLRDVIFGGAGNDSIDGGYGNDLIYGMDGNDSIAGGYGSDELVGQDGNDVITGAAFSDLIFGGAGNDFVNGGYGHDRVNGGAGADKFYHLGIAGHGSDWIQDYTAAEDDVLSFGGSGATADDFQVNLTHSGEDVGSRAGDDTVQEAFVIYKPTGQILWALVDGAGQDQINIEIGGEVFDLM